ncbi:stalk domain-containing protein [Saccharibacillus sp. CPCC 101409]|uniref:stalk domain-containing protein n=1 Tax=Saccharibacillus sp. CPCC 101409 TaxID=3058041 RepID=UPI00267217C8|nr:stalk domain-containing protein [Saccharibacillus sp. CPCC 101409]MDO3412031.1 stalk domain-containing protein [Saccharibacillus sp. CPCC 101409]
MRLAKKGAALLLVLLMTLAAAMPVMAAEKVTLAFQVKVGSSAAVVNGEKETIEKPYTQNGITLVPLGLFQRAFGTTSRLEGEDVVRLAYGSHNAVFTIGSKTAKVNGKKVTLKAAPAMKRGTLMVPLRAVTDMLGAEVKVSSGTITVSLVSENGIPGKTPAENETGAELRVGSSFAQWSIDYPDGALVEPGSDEYTAYLGDSDGNYMLQIQVWAEDGVVPTSDMIEQLEREALQAGETIIHRETVSADLPYARLITRDEDGLYWENRRYYDNGRVYTLYMGDSTIEDYRSFTQDAPLLDSFRTSFQVGKTRTEDLSGVQNGYAQAVSYPYGASLELPADWAPTSASEFRYQSPDGAVLSLDVTSAQKGGTLDSWHTTLQNRTNEIFQPGIAQPIRKETTRAAGKTALLDRLTYNLGGGDYTWSWLVIEDQGYFYVLRYSAPPGTYNEETFRHIADSLEIDFEAVPGSFGTLGEISYLKDKSLNATYSTNDFQFSVPAYWTSQTDNYTQSSDIDYFIPGGSFKLTTLNAGLEAAAAQTIRGYDDLKLDDSTFAYESPQHITFAGVPAIRIAYQGTKDGNPYQGQTICFRHGNRTFVIRTELNRGTATPVQLAAIERTLQSFKFLK